STFTIIMVILFFVSSADSNTFVLSSLSSRGSFAPRRPVIATWGALTGGCAIVLLLVGGLQALQQAAMLSAVPFTAIVVILGIALIKELRCDHQIAEVAARERCVRRRPLPVSYDSGAARSGSARWRLRRRRRRFRERRSP